ncbi:unnamed protein product [Candidula unifasciata]|uniref:Major facilitator superfamily (MFS) profile domain-containing protein n=1 Tax=Candidula unifasciata TaxID=100452 RepID=A0A8S3YS76_9EUPU|nr:unnamed protein product [Candidula unifasciata]
MFDATEKVQINSGNISANGDQKRMTDKSKAISYQSNGPQTHINTNYPGYSGHTPSTKESNSESTVYVWTLAFFAAIGGFLFGYDTGVVSGAMLLIKKEFGLSSLWQELIVSITIGGAFLAALVGGFLNDLIGRKKMTIVASFVCFASMTVPVYIAESAPFHLRGRLVTINNMFITGGQLVASLVDGAFSYMEHNGWRYMLGLAAVPSVVQLIGFIFLPESPRWLMKKGLEQRARNVLVKMRGTTDVEEEMDEMKIEFEQEKANVNKNGIVFIRILKTPPVRRALIVGCSLQLFQQLCGINTVMYYSATIIKMAGINNDTTAIWLAALTAGINFLFTLVGVWLVERLGRRKLLLLSLFGTMLSLVVLAVSFQLAAFNSPEITTFDHSTNATECSSYRWCEDCIENSGCGFCFTGSVGSTNGSCLVVDPADDERSKDGTCGNATLPAGFTWSHNYCPTSYSWMAILGLALYLMCFAPGMGPMPWTINSEIHPLWARSTGNALSAATNWVFNLLVSMTFLTMTETITKYGTYWLFVGISVVGLVFFLVFLPETKGSKLEDVEELFSRPWSSCCSTSEDVSVAEKSTSKPISEKF